MVEFCMTKNDIITIGAFSPGGWFHGTGENEKNYCVYYTDTGEILNAEWFRKKRKNFSKFHETIDHPSPWREAPPCPYYGQCGGCDLQHLSLERELQLKTAAAESLTGIAPERVVSSPLTYGYRNNMEYTVSEGVVGLHGKLSRRLTDIKECMLAPPEINAALSAFREEAGDFEGEIRFKTCDEGIISRRYPKYVSKEADPDNIIAARKTIGGIPYFVSPDTFFQSNDSIMPLWLDVIEGYARETAGKGSVLDLYCGSGTISLRLATLFDGVAGIESNAVSVGLAVRSAAEAGLGPEKARYIEGDLNDYDLSGLAPELLIVNPPRGGLSDAVIRFILEKRFPSVIYSSCNVNSFSRDIGLLRGYGLEKYALINMFPRTSHFEVVGKLNLSEV